MREMTVVPYDSRWPERYESERAVLSGIFGDTALDIQHFGSTSIEGMTAKPIIDIIVAVADINAVDTFNEAMRGRGFIPRGEHGIPGRRYFVRLDEDGENHLTHVHVYEMSNEHVTDELMFRDYLRINRAAFNDYERVKLVAARQYRHEPAAYTDAKHDCVMLIMDKARAYYAH